MRQLSGNCPDNNCPKLFEDGDTYVVQGDMVSADVIQTPDGESAVRVPKAILDVLKTEA